MTGAPTPGGSARLELMDWRRRVLDMYARARTGGGAAEACARFRAERERLLREHPQSPLPERDRSRRLLAWFPWRPEWRVEAPLEAVGTGNVLVIATSTGEPTRFTRVGRVRAQVPTGEVVLSVFWLEGYGGGLFLPFRDATSGAGSYGGGRYLLDTVKGADLGVADGGALVLDFNYAYNPSCSYDPRWSCPLAPPENRLGVAVEAGEAMPAAFA